MENASKALIVAGSILLSILIISVGLYVVNSTNVDVSGSMNQIEHDVFNQKYLMYDGKQMGTVVKKLLLQAALDNEEIYLHSNAPSLCIGIRASSPEILSRSISSSMTSGLNGTRSYGVIYSTNIRKISNWVKLKKKYNISFGFGTNGRINEISIDDIN